ncbi:unnamed protein product [Ectocarpus sp. CCAP 1310/34]|nr:unnamed protein product [Ectocarpus sp. CCAP 1310/34]
MMPKGEPPRGIQRATEGCTRSSRRHRTLWRRRQSREQEGRMRESRAGIALGVHRPRHRPVKAGSSRIVGTGGAHMSAKILTRSVVTDETLKAYLPVHTLSSAFACVDPDAACVDDDSVTVDILENCAIAANISDGYCSEDLNTEECGRATTFGYCRCNRPLY